MSSIDQLINGANAAKSTMLDDVVKACAEAEKLAIERADRIEALEQELETERMRLAACGVAALGYFDGCKDEYRSASLDDTLRLYAKCGSLESEVKEQALQYVSSFGQCKEHMERISALEQLAKEMADALEKTSRFTIDGVTQCRGDKCRDPWCASCNTEEDANAAVQEAWTAYDVRNKALSRYREVCGGDS